MSVAAVNITIEQGEDFSHTFNIIKPDENPAQLDGYNAIATMRKYPGSATGYEFTVTLDIINSTVKIELPNTTTSSLKYGRYYYDVFLVSTTGTRIKVSDGNAIVNSSATLSI